MSGQKDKNSIVHIEPVADIFSYEEIRRVMAKMLEGLKGDLILPEKARIVVKLNLCLLKGPETGATVEPLVAKALVEWFLENFDIEKIYLAESDATHLGANMAFQILGWQEMFGDMDKVELFNLSEDETVFVGGNGLGGLNMAKTMMEADLLISLAKLKTHTQQKITCILKNQFGAIPFKYKITYHGRLSEAICEAAATRLPELCIVDGLIGMEGNGPTNGTPKRTKLLLAGNDPVAMDHFCARLMGFNPLDIPHLKMASEKGLGRTDYKVRGNPPNPLNLKFQFLPRWKEVVKKGIGLVARGGINEEA